MREEWRGITGLELFYEVSDMGRVRNFKTKRILSSRTNPKGREQITLTVKDKSYTKQIHILVSRAFLGSPSKDSPQVNHIDGNHSNNAVSNLRYVSAKTNFDAYWQSERSGTHWLRKRQTADHIVKDIRSSKNTEQLAIKHNMSMDTIRQIKSGRRCKSIQSSDYL